MDRLQELDVARVPAAAPSPPPPATAPVEPPLEVRKGYRQVVDIRVQREHAGRAESHRRLAETQVEQAVLRRVLLLGAMVSLTRAGARSGRSGMKGERDRSGF